MSGAPKYKIGDLVCLKSGGAVMTICNYKGSYNTELRSENFDGSYACQWFAGKKLDKGFFPEDSLILATDMIEPLTKKQILAK